MDCSPEPIEEAKTALDAHTVEMVQWHFGDDTGSPFWLEKKKEFDFDPLTDVKCFDDLKQFPLFEDDWLRGGRFVVGYRSRMPTSRCTYSKRVERQAYRNLGS